MDVLIDLIIYVIRQLSKQSSPQGPSAQRTSADIERQKAEVERRIREMQSALAQQKGKAAPLPAPTPRKAKRVAKKTASAEAVPTLARAVETRAVETPVVTAPSRSISIASTQRRKWIVPILIGEVLGPPLALRESQI